MAIPIRGWTFDGRVRKTTNRFGLIARRFPISALTFLFFLVAAVPTQVEAQTPDSPNWRNMRRTLEHQPPRMELSFANIDMQWDGVISNDDPLEILGDRAIIDNRLHWHNVWASWRPKDPVPVIDFDTDFVFVLIAQGPNVPRMQPNSSHNDAGDVTIVAESTLIGGPGFGYRFLKIPRTGVRSINGVVLESLTPDQNSATPEDQVRVVLTGKLETGVMATGGQSTGVTITARDITMEMEFETHPELAKVAEHLNGSRARVAGSLRLQQGVENSDRWIIDVAEIQPVED